MIESRRIASATPPSSKTPSLSGPRCTRREFIRLTASTSGAPSLAAMPQIPHMAAQSRRTNRAQTHRHVPVDCSAGGGGASACDLDHGGQEDADVERDGAVGYVLHVVGELVGPGLLAGHPRLGEAGDAGTNHQPLPVLGDLLAQLGE